jgi:hypothetical protein
MGGLGSAKTNSSEVSELALYLVCSAVNVDAALITKINVQSLSTLLKNRTTVEIRKLPPEPSHRGSARLRTEPLILCRRKPAYRKRED